MWASFSDWLFSQAPTITVLGIWVISLHVILRERSRRIQQLEKRSDELSASLAELVQSNSRERAERVTLQITNLESLMRSAFETLLRALESRRPVLPRRSTGG